MGFINTDNQQTNEGCVSTAYQPMSVSVPVTVRPVVYDLPATISCCGDPYIRYRPIPCRGGNNICSFVLTQNLCLEIPIVIGANTMVGNPFVNCGAATGQDVCTDCETQPENMELGLKPKLTKKPRGEKHWSSTNVIY